MTAPVESSLPVQPAGPTPSNAWPAVSGLAVLIVGGVLAALLAARWLQPGPYTVFAAFSAVLGLLVLGPASSLEQESALYGRSRGGPAFLAQMGRRAAVLWGVTTVLVLLPLAGWQDRLWGDAALLATALVVLGVPPIFMLAIARGVATAHGHNRLVGAIFAVVGVATVAFPPLLHELGMSLLSAFLVGAVVAWLPAIIVLAVVVATRNHVGDLREKGPDGGHPRRVTALVALGNLLVLGNLLAVPAVLRWHVEKLDVVLVADVQLLVSVTKLSTTVALGFLPLAIARIAASGTEAQRHRETRGLVVVALALGCVSVLGALLLAGTFVAGLTGRATALTGGVTLLAALPVVALCPAIILTGVALTQRRHSLVIIAWGSGLLALVAALAVDPAGDVEVVLGAILLAAILPVILLGGASAVKADRSSRRRGVTA